MCKILNTYFLFFLFSLSLAQAQSSPPERQSKMGAKSFFRKNILGEKGPYDSTKIHFHSPTKAMIFSACIPGLGQAYNKKYWKIPVVYASLGATLYFFQFNDKIYKEYKQAYINKTDTLASTVDIYPNASKDDVLFQVNYYRRYRDLNVILAALFYTLNCVDAYVDAHLMNFDVSDNLSFHIAPALNLQARQKSSAGLTLTMRF